MNDFQDIKRMLLPALKGLPIIAGCFVVAMILAYRSILYTNPTYESTAKIKLDDIGHGISSSTLYEDFDVFANTNKIAAEVEVLRSALLINKALDKLDFDVSYFRVGRIRTTELYHNSPFLVDWKANYTPTNSQQFELEILDESTFTLQHQGQAYQGRFGQELEANGYHLTIKLNRELMDQQAVDLVDQYQFKIHAPGRRHTELVGDRLDITSVEEDVAVVRVSYKSEVPAKTAAFVNALAETYVEDYIDSRTGAAGKTVRFIDDQLETIGQELRDSEARLEEYRLENNIINTRQETETDLRKIAQLKIQLSNIEMNEAALDSLHNYLNRPGGNFLEMAPNFEAYNDLLSTELIKKLKAYQAEKKDLLLKYTPADEKVQVIDSKITDIENYIRESIGNSRMNLQIKREQIERNIAQAEEVFIGLPTREKQMVILERDFQLNQKIYNFLTEKRTESAIAEAVNIAFHRIIQHATIPREPIAPRKSLVLIVSALLGLITGLAFVYIRQFINGKIQSRSELEKLVETPIAGIVKQQKANSTDASEFQTLAVQLDLISKIESHQTLLVTSAMRGEGKSFVAVNLARAYAALGRTVVLVDLNLHDPTLHKLLDASKEPGIEALIREEYTLDHSLQQTDEENLMLLAAGTRGTAVQAIESKAFRKALQELQAQFDLVIIDGPAAALAPEAIRMMQLADHVFHVVRAGFTPSSMLTHADLIAEEYDLSNGKILLNDTHPAHNFSGHYTGSRFSYNPFPTTVFGRLKHYIRSYA